MIMIIAHKILSYKSCNNLLNLYIKGLLAFFNEGILNIPGNKLIKISVIKESPKLDNTSKNR